MSGTTSAQGTEAMTLSMINGEDAVFQEQVAQLIQWIKEQEKPDIIHLSSSLLLGIARMIRLQMDIPIICSVQDEEVWIDSMNEKDASLPGRELLKIACDIDRFITTSEFYKEFIRQRLLN